MHDAAYQRSAPNCLSPQASSLSTLQIIRSPSGYFFLIETSIVCNASIQLIAFLHDFLDASLLQANQNRG